MNRRDRSSQDDGSSFMINYPQKGGYLYPVRIYGGHFLEGLFKTERKEIQMNKIQQILQNEKVQGAIAIAAAVVMYFTPDHIDAIIEACLAAFGIKKMTFKKEE